MNLRDDLRDFHTTERNKDAMHWLDLCLAFALGVFVSILVVIVFNLDRIA